MAGLNAGSVYATLGGNFNPAGFAQFGGAMNKAKADMAGAERSIAQSSKRSSSAVHALGAAGSMVAKGGVLALGAALVGSVKKAADFEAQLSSLGSAADANGAQMAKLRKQAMDAGAATKFSALDAAKAQTELAKAGMSVDNVLKGGLKGALALAAAGEMELADAASTTANALNLFGLGGNQATHVADALAMAANATTADVSDFSAALTQGGSAAKAAGMTFDQTVVALESLASAGIKGSDAGTSLKSMLTQTAKPSKESAAAMKDLGLTFFDAGGKFKNLATLSKDLGQAFKGKSEQEKLALATTIAGTDGQRALLSLLDASPASLRKYASGLREQGTAAEVAAKKQDNFKGRLENFKGSVETLGISIGSKLLPGLSRFAEQATQALNGVDGAEVGTKIAAGFDTAVDVLGDVVSTGRDVAGVFLDIAQALNLGDAGNLKAIVAGIAGFKIAKFVASDVMALAGGVKALTGAAKGGTLMSGLLKGLSANPITAVAVAAGLAAAAVIRFGGSESRAAQISRESAAAHKANAEAIKSVMDAELGAADKGLAAKQANLDLQQAKQDTAAAAKGPGGRKSDEYKQALLAEQQATLRATASQKEYGASITAQTKAGEKAVKVARDRFEAAKKEAEELAKPRHKGGRASAGVLAEDGKKNAEEQAQASKAMQSASRDYVQALARQNVSETSRQRLMQAGSQITQKNAEGISNLIHALDGVPKSKQTKILMSGDQGALSRVGNLIAGVKSVPTQKAIKAILNGSEAVQTKLRAVTALIAGVPPSKVTTILAQTNGEESVRNLQSAINALQSRTIDVTTRLRTIGAEAPAGGAGGNRGGGPARPAPRRASGRGRGGFERALVAEGGGPEWRINPQTGEMEKMTGAQFRDLSPADYIIPTEPKYRGRALGLLADVAKDLGARGYKKGKKGKGKAQAKRILPAPPSDFRLSDPADLRADVDQLTGRLSAANSAKDERKQLKNGKQGGLTKAAIQARKDIREAKRELAVLKPLLRKANKAAALIRGSEENAANEYSAMDLADKRNNQAGYDQALVAYRKNLGSEQERLQTIYDVLVAAKKDDTTWGRAVRGRLLDVKGKVQDASTAKSTAQQEAENPAAGPETEADRLLNTGFTDAERAAIENSDRDVALAALTETLGDDKTAAGSRVSLFQGILASAMAAPDPRGGSSAVADIAGSLKSAKDTMLSLTTGGTTNDNQDVQAQLEQQRERTRIAESNSRALGAAFTAFAGPGDIGTGRFGNAIGAVQPGITINTLHPGDPRILDEIGRAATGGLGLQGGIPSSSKKVGI